MAPTVTTLACAQCGRQPAPLEDLASWKHAQQVLDGEVDPSLLLCPECRAEHLELEYDEGEAAG